MTKTSRFTYAVGVVPLKPSVEMHYEVSTRMERLYQLASDLETALQDAERQRTQIAKLRDEADAISRLFEASHNGAKGPR